MPAVDCFRFAIDKRPVCVWMTEGREATLEFLRTFNSKFFDYVARLCADGLEGDHKQLAACNLRVVYGQALEAFFALVATTIQAPECPFAWLAMYRTKELQSLIRKVGRGERVRSRLTINPASWSDLSEIVHEGLLIADKERERATKAGFARLWERLAQDFLDETGNVEYNSMKHGFRAALGGTEISIGEETTAGVAAAAADMRSLGGSIFGSSSLVPEPVSGSKTNYRVKRMFRNWSPVNLSNGLILLSMSMQNVVARLLAHSGEDPRRIKYRYPTTLDEFDLPLRRIPGVWEGSFQTTLELRDSDLLNADEILKIYEPQAFGY